MVGRTIAHYEITGDAKSSQIMAQKALEYGYFEDCALVLRLRDKLEEEAGG